MDYGRAGSHYFFIVTDAIGPHRLQHPPLYGAVGEIRSTADVLVVEPVQLA